VLQSNFTGTEVLFERAREIWSRFYGLQDPHVGLVYANLAAMQYARGDYAEAEKRLDEAAPLLERLPGEHPLRAVPMNLRAAIRHCRGDYEGARSTAEDALRIARAGLGSDHACILPIYDNLTAIYLGQAQYAKAVRLSDRRATRAEEIWGPEHPFLIQGLNRRVAVLTLPRSARYAEAGDDCQRAQRICRATLGNDHPAMVTELHAQGRLEMRQPQKSDSRYEAKRCLIKAGETWKKCLKEHPALVKENLEQALILADLAEAIASNRLAGYQAALDMLEKCGGAEHPEIARLLCEMALVQMEQEKWNEAAASLDRALAIQKKRLAANHPDRADALEVYGKLLSKMNPPDPDKAAELQKQAKDIRASHEKDEQAEANRQS
jgi:tetratricopeptide (TPR) repeat protein